MLSQDDKKLPNRQRRTDLPEKIRSGLVAAIGRLIRAQRSPDELLGDLFSEVQLRQIYSDGKSFADSIPKKRVRELKKEYELARQDPNFDLEEFVARHFQTASLELGDEQRVVTNAETARQHVTDLWPHLRRTAHNRKGSLFALPNPYIVPGGRFSEQFYWDSYFIMLGLVADDDWKMVRNMIKNNVFMIDKMGFIPTANRSYFTSRSQPPFFALMIQLLLTKQNNLLTKTEYLATLVREHSFWMRNRKKAKKTTDGILDRVVIMPEGGYLNRYYDDKISPRPESHREDVETAKVSGSDCVFLDLRAAAESGWDFSSRWFADPQEINTIHATDYLAVDLNCLLYVLENTIADSYRALLQTMQANLYQMRADRRASLIQKYMWSEKNEFFVDYDISSKEQSPHITLAGVFPLYVKIATKDQAEKIAKKLEKDFLKPGGLVTTLAENGQQWDTPNGWAPLHWVTIIGLRNYGFDDLADKIKQSWQATIEKTYDKYGKMVEKYNVVDTDQLGGGGEYTLQDGFGWTNGVYAALHDDLDLEMSSPVG